MKPFVGVAAAASTKSRAEDNGAARCSGMRAALANAPRRHASPPRSPSLLPDGDAPLSKLGVQHGDMLFMAVGYERQVRGRARAFAERGGLLRSLLGGARGGECALFM